MEQNLKRYFALAITIILGLSIVYMLKDFLTPIFSAFILTFLFYPTYNALNTKLKKPNLSAMVIVITLILIILVPVSAIAGFMLSQINGFELHESEFNSIEQKIFSLTGQEISVADTLISLETWVKSDGVNFLPDIVSYTSNFLLSVFIMCFIMFYLLIEKDVFLKNVIRLMPFSKNNSNYLLNESGDIVRAVVIGQILTAFIQGLLGMFALVLAGVENAFFWGIIMMVLSLIPVVGAFLIWLPAGLFLIFNGDVGWGIFILAWGAIVVSQVDNLVRPKLVNKFANIHPVETFLGIFMGLATFGMIGIIVGPLFISLFKVFLFAYRKEYSVNVGIN